jgi:hypothetical protein
MLRPFAPCVADLLNHTILTDAQHDYLHETGINHLDNELKALSKETENDKKKLYTISLENPFVIKHDQFLMAFLHAVVTSVYVLLVFEFEHHCITEILVPPKRVL